VASRVEIKAATSYVTELGQTARLGLPLALGELGWMSTYIVDAIMIGRLPHSALAIAASHPLAGIYTNDAQVVAAAVPLFYLCSLLILGDTCFVIFASALTGLGDTRTPMWVSIVCNWCLGMPLAYLLAFRFGYGLHGLWMGRAIASLSSGMVLTASWYARMRREQQAGQTHSLQLPALIAAR
jgi:Na+-driven multidrug efflux pump